MNKAHEFWGCVQFGTGRTICRNCGEGVNDCNGSRLPIQSKCIECETAVTPGPGFQLCEPCREAINNPPETMEEAFRKWWKAEPFTDEIRSIVKRGWDAGCAWTNLAMLERNQEEK